MNSAPATATAKARATWQPTAAVTNKAGRALQSGPKAATADKGPVGNTKAGNADADPESQLTWWENFSGSPWFPLNWPMYIAIKLDQWLF